MRKSEMNEEQLRSRTLFVETLAAAGWRGLRFNEDFDRGFKISPEASMTYSNRKMTLRFDFICEDPRLILYIDSAEGKSLGLVFRCADQPKPLLDAVVKMRDTIAPENIKEKSAELLEACPKMFKISASGDKLIPVKPKRSG